MEKIETKNTNIEVNGKNYTRIAIKTHLVSDKDNIIEIADKYTKDFRSPGDMLIISERIVAISQGRSYLIKDIKPGFWANLLYKYVTKNPGGIGLRSPHTMQLALTEAGLPRILFACIFSVITKPFGVKGVFYHIAGNGLNAIDGPCDYTLYPGNISAKLGPKDAPKVAQQISDALGLDVVIIDANDLGRRVEGASKNADKKFAEEVFRDNPLGQRDEQTPMALIKR
jgi:F420-0:gamma-glutamyl ligase